MAYKIQITTKASLQLDNIVNYIVNVLCNPKAAVDLMDDIDEAYRKLVDTPKMYAQPRDRMLRRQGYRKIPVGEYVILYLVDEEDQVISIMGYFHSLENYNKKL